MNRTLKEIKRINEQMAIFLEQKKVMDAFVIGRKIEYRGTNDDVWRRDCI